MSVCPRLVVVCGTTLGLLSCASTTARLPASRAGTREVSPPTESDESPDASATQTGYATWYGPGFAGRKMANGQRFDPSAMTAAHRTLPLGTWVDVTRRDTGRTVRVRITDRGPFGEHSRIIDLSKGAAAHLDMIRMGVAPVELRIVPGP